MNEELLKELLEADVSKDKELNAKFTRAYTYLDSRYMKEPRSMDDDMMYSLITAYEMINRVLSVYEEQREQLRPEYIIRKLNIAKATINSHIKYQEEKLDKLMESERKPLEYLDQIKTVFGIAASNNPNEPIIEDAIKIITRGTATESEMYFLLDMTEFVNDILQANYDLSYNNANLQNDVIKVREYLRGELFNGIQ